MPSFDPNAQAAPGSGVFGLPHTPQEAAWVLIPVPFEATASYGGGCSKGPAAILEASHQVDLYDLETGRPYERGIALISSAAEIRNWNERATGLARPFTRSGETPPKEVRSQVDRFCHQVNEWVYARAKEWIARGKAVGTLGGDHGTSFGAIRAHAERWPGLGVLHIDAHADLRERFEGFRWSHASIMFNVLEELPGVSKIVQVGVRDLCEAEAALIRARPERISTHFDAEIAARRFAGRPWKKQLSQIVAGLPRHVYVSFDIDGLEPNLCPHTGTPVPGGLSFQEASSLLGAVVESGRTIIGFDLTEVSPDPDGGEWDANVAARVLYKLIGWAEASRGKKAPARAPRRLGGASSKTSRPRRSRNGR